MMPATLRRLFLLIVLANAVAAVTAASPDVTADQLPRIPPTGADRAAETISVRPGFRIELMAAEPLVVDPIAIAFDEEARAYVIEMRDYSERRDDRLGRVKLLYDDNDDGRYDRAVVFAEGLPWPTGVTCWDGGVFVVSSPDLWYLKDTDGDGIADLREVVITGFGELVTKWNVQQLPNSLQWGPDQRIHLAVGGNASHLRTSRPNPEATLDLNGRDLSFDPRLRDLRSEPGGGQWGITFDDIGRKFTCTNSNHFLQDVFPAFALQQSPMLSGAPVNIAEDGPQAEVYRTSPVEPWRLLRTQWRVAANMAGIEGGGRASGYFTSACGITCYRGDAFPVEYVGNFFIADCGSNLIHRKITQGHIRLSARRPDDETSTEFAASSDNWFRPVAFANAPDGCLWVCDMYREIVEHPLSIPPAIKQHLDLNSGNDRGRLWRFVPNGYQPRVQSKPSRLSSTELVSLLASPNGWHRDTAARLLHERADRTVVSNLTKLLQQSPQPIGRMTALRVLTSLTEPDEVPWAIAIADADSKVRTAALVLLGTVFQQRDLSPSLRHSLQTLIHDQAPDVRFAFAMLLPFLPAPERTDAITTLCDGDLASLEFRQVLLAQVGDAATGLWVKLSKSDRVDHRQFTQQLIRQIGQRAQPDEIALVFQSLPKTTHAAFSLQPLADGIAHTGKNLTDLAPISAIETLREVAAKSLDESTTDPDCHVCAYQILGLIGTTEWAPAIAASLSVHSTRAEVLAAIEALDRLRPDDLGKLFTQLWAKIPLSTQASLIQTWRSRPAIVDALLTALESGIIPPSDISTTDTAALRALRDPQLAQRVEAIFGAPGSREAALEKYHPAIARGGSAKLGKPIFRTRCATCHRKMGEGTPIGPDLETVLNSGKEKILMNILDPSREVTIGFVTGILQTVDGLTVSGIIVDESSAGITLKIAGQSPRTFPRAEIEEFRRSPKSLMPEGLETGISLEEMSHLLEFLTTSKLTMTETNATK